jgi:hypothetical protein
VSLGQTNEVTGFLGACAQVSGFSPTYRRNGYNLLQRWGAVLRELPQGAVAQMPEILAFFKNGTEPLQVLFRVAVNTPLGGRSYVDMAEKTSSGQWLVVGNQRNYDASVEVRMLQANELSTNGFVPGDGPDSGHNVGTFSRYETRLAFTFNQAGPNGADVYAVRITGPGLPSAGIVLARSTACGTHNYLAFYNGTGTLPAASASAMPTNSASNAWRLAAQPLGTGYRGTEAFWGGLRRWFGTNPPYPETQVDLSTIPDLARYRFEVFTVAGGTTPSVFHARIVTRPVGPQYAALLPWATPTASTLEYMNPTVTAKAGALSSVDLAWATRRQARSCIPPTCSHAATTRPTTSRA